MNRAKLIKRGEKLWPWLAVFLGNAALFIVLWVLVRWGYLQSWYIWIWAHTTARPWTFIMRDYPILLIIPMLAILAVAARWFPLRYWARIIFMDVVLVLGIVFGHVFWGG